ncbi:FecCD family ABC transporter permease [Dietzia timorensis]|uniref:Ferric enterobactin transport system permease prote in FepG n=1 Tax=Dietzia timorensis TaxID=499555 RepID=A0A173LI11_9ACTN|nr:iron chelate uptake ABC transporter family permease subunit [Dietzia timorensis]ANI91966.1 Ferric enterobactin transport system permease prote in FepG [Dietzia timorensis]
MTATSTRRHQTPILRPGEFILPTPRMRLRYRSIATGAVLLVVLLLALVVEVGQGDYPIPAAEVIQSLLGGGNDFDRIVILEWRMPRALVGILVGVGLAAAGAVTQTLARNALASPDIIGITMGASAFAVGAIVTFPAFAAHIYGVPIAAITGGLVTSGLVWILAWRGGMDPLRLVLIGVGMNAIAGAAVTYFLVRADINLAAEASAWLAGSLTGRTWSHVIPVALTSTLGVGIVVALARSLHALSFGDDIAKALGVPADRVRAALWCAAIVMAAGAVAAAGPVGFVALAAPQLARLISGEPNPPLLASGLCGGALVLVADLAGTALFSDTSFPVGVVTAVLGAPFLIFCLVQANRKSTV